MLIDPVVCSLLDAFTIPPGFGAVDRLRQLQEALTTEALATDLTSPDAGHQEAIAAALDTADPRPDASRLFPDRLQRLRSLVDEALFVMTTGLTQPQGPSGATAVSLP